MGNIKKILLPLGLTLLLVTAMFITWVYSRIDASLPKLDGKQTIYGLEYSATINRDVNGVPTIIAKNRHDLAVATGFVHAQERFFQMDLLRRNSAGELSSLFGSLAIDYDKRIRLHRFRQRAKEIVNTLPPQELKILRAYTQGVNQGLRRLNAKPFEYLLLQTQPAEWLPEDTILTVFSMYLDLQYEDGARERALGLMANVFSEEVFQFLNPKGSKWDAAIDDTSFPASPLPKGAWPAASGMSATNHVYKVKQTHPLAQQSFSGDHLPGSNNWAVSGNISSTGSAIVANDMHLGIRVPNTWFRASLVYKDGNKDIKVTGVTLPGAPLVVAGSNGNIAWGFTNSYGDYSDVIELVTSEDNSQYLTPNGFTPFTDIKQMIAVNGESAHELTIRETIWGPVIGENAQGRLQVYRWVAHDKNAVNLTALELEQAQSVKHAFNIAARSGIPSQNMMVGDSKGNIGWTIMGPIPKRTTVFGETPTDWSTGEYAWSGYLTPQDYPKVYNPKSDRLWTGNSRVVGGEMFDKLGNGGYALGARSKQIKQGLFAKEQFDEASLLAIALDDKATFLSPWQTFLLNNVLTDDNIAKHPSWQEAKEILSQEKALAATIDSVAYRLVRNFRYQLRDDVFSLFQENLEKLEEDFSLRHIRHQLETPLWEMVNQQPDNFQWLPDKSWSDVLENAFNKTLVEMTKDQPLAEATWGKQNIADIKHPLASSIPIFGNSLIMPKVPLAGDSYMPRVQGKAFGASERMVVSPGHEQQGLFHMPTSQSGHPWSPYFGKGHQDWVEGKASPFLPQETVYSLTLLGY